MTKHQKGLNLLLYILCHLSQCCIEYLQGDRAQPTSCAQGCWGCTLLTVSKEMRVRIDGFVKIMAMVLPAKGLKLSSRCLNFSFTCGYPGQLL